MTTAVRAFDVLETVRERGGASVSELTAALDVLSDGDGDRGPRHRRRSSAHLRRRTRAPIERRPALRRRRFPRRRVHLLVADPRFVHILETRRNSRRGDFRVGVPRVHIDRERVRLRPRGTVAIGPRGRVGPNTPSRRSCAPLSVAPVKSSATTSTCITPAVGNYYCRALSSSAGCFVIIFI